MPRNGKRRSQPQLIKLKSPARLAGYAPLFKKLSLNEDQVSQFKALLTFNVRRRGDLADFSRSEGTRPVDRDVSDLNARNTELANAIRSDFGDATLEAFQYFNATGPLRELAGTLTSTLATTPRPARPTKQTSWSIFSPGIASNLLTPRRHLLHHNTHLVFEPPAAPPCATTRTRRSTAECQPSQHRTTGGRPRLFACLSRRRHEGRLQTNRRPSPPQSAIEPPVESEHEADTLREQPTG